jgi:hypothetical protein
MLAQPGKLGSPTMNYDLVIKNGQVTTAREDFIGDVAVTVF